MSVIRTVPKSEWGQLASARHPADVADVEHLQIKKLMLPIVGGDYSRVMVRRVPEDPRQVKVKLKFDDHEELYLMSILDAPPLSEDEYYRDDDKFPWLHGHGPRYVS